MPHVGCVVAQHLVHAEWLEAIEALLYHVHDLPEEGLVKLIVFILSSVKQEVRSPIVAAFDGSIPCRPAASPVLAASRPDSGVPVTEYWRVPEGHAPLGPGLARCTALHDHTHVASARFLLCSLLRLAEARRVCAKEASGPCCDRCGCVRLLAC